MQCHEPRSQCQVLRSAQVGARLPRSRGVLHRLEASEVVDIPDVTRDGGVHFFQGRPRPGSLFAAAVRDASGGLCLAVVIDRRV